MIPLSESAKRFKRFDFLRHRETLRDALAHKSKRLESAKRFTSVSSVSPSNIPVARPFWLAVPVIEAGQAGRHGAGAEVGRVARCSVLPAPDRDWQGGNSIPLSESAKRFKRFDFLRHRETLRDALAHKSKRLESPKRFTSVLPSNIPVARPFRLVVPVIEAGQAGAPRGSSDMDTLSSRGR